jgi:acyl carrier protein
MGLDFVELIISIEDAFDISINDDEAEHIATVGDCHKFILKKIGDRDEKKCLTVHAFNRLRKVLMDEMDIKRKDFHPNKNLNDLIPKNVRRKLWGNLAEKLQLEVPKLIKPNWLKYILIAVILIFIISAMIGHGLGLLTIYVYLLIIPTSLLITWASFKLTYPFEYDFGFREKTVGDLTNELVKLNFGTTSREVRSWSDEQVWDKMKELIVYQLGVKPEEVVSSAEFIKDLGAD